LLLYRGYNLKQLILGATKDIALFGGTTIEQKPASAGFIVFGWDSHTD